MRIVRFATWVFCAIPVFGALAAPEAPMRPLPLPAEAGGGAEPLKGLALWSDNDSMEELSGSISLEFGYWFPAQVVRGKRNGELLYDWTAFDRWLDAVKTRGHKAIVRFRYEYPGEAATRGGVRGATGVPAYIKASPDYRETFSQNPNGDGPTYYADWRNAELKSFTLRFYEDFAARYDRDPRVAFVEIGFGHWSEYHIEGTPLRLGVNFPDKTYQSEFLRRMDGLFRETPWLLSIDAAEKERSPIVSDPALLSLGFGLFDDSFLHAEHERAQGDGYNEACFEALGAASRWKRAPVGGEISYDKDSDQKNFLGPKGIHGWTWERAAKKYHVTFMIANDATEGRFATPARVLEAGRNAGYRLRASGFKAGGGRAEVTIENVGIAPVYHDLRVEMGHICGKTSLRGLQPGEKRHFSVEGVNEITEPRIVGIKLYPGETIPYETRP